MSATETFSLYDRFYPAAPAGRYTLDLTHTLYLNKNKEGDRYTETSAVEFTVATPRFILPPGAAVHSMHPHPERPADHGTILPHVVLGSRSLPWEIPLRGKLGPEPWLALLILAPSDIAQATIRKTTLGELADAERAKNGGPWSPWSDDEAKKELSELTSQDKETKINVLEIGAHTLRGLCPTTSELSLLAHVRKVAVDRKSEGLAFGTGELSVVMANRFPQAGENLAVLVSLEGWANWLDTADHPAKGRLAVIVLHSWKFTSKGATGSFGDQVRAITDIAGFAVKTSCADAGTNARLAAGYVPIAYALEDGQRTAAWYRGPFVPAQVASWDAASPSFLTAGSALAIDRETGMLDVSYASAWQLGRLLAFGDAGFAAAVRRWTERRQRPSGDAPEQTSLIQMLADHLAAHAAPDLQRTTAFDDLLTIRDWLAALTMLVPVPLPWLVPSPKLLPPESLRVFHLDQNWVDALVDGALTLGSTSPDIRKLRAAPRSEVRAALGALFAGKGIQQLAGEGIQQPSGPMTVPATPARGGSVTGFLLRTSLLAAWPGMEVEAFGTSGALNVLRQVRVSADVLFVLVEGTLAKVQLREPREGLRFGYSGAHFIPRITEGSGLGSVSAKSAYDLSAEQWRREGFPGVLRVQKLADALEGDGTAKSSARFALHLLRPPEDVWVYWNPDATKQEELRKLNQPQTGSTEVHQ